MKESNGFNYENWLSRLLARPAYVRGQDRAIGEIAWRDLAIAAIDDPEGIDPVDEVRRSDLRIALAQAYTAGYMVQVNEGEEAIRDAGK